MNGPPMTRDEVDRAIVALGAAYDRIAAAMFDLDNHQALAFLRDSVLSGATAARWRQVRPRVDALWAQFSALGEVLERARAVRDRRSRPGESELRELAGLLREPAVALDDAGLPVSGSAGAGALGAGVPGAGAVGTGTAGAAAETVDAAVLAGRLERDSAIVMSLLADVDAAWSAVAARITTITGHLDAAVALAREVDAGAPTEFAAGVAPETAGVDRLVRDLSQATGDALADPLTAAPAGGLARLVDERLSRLGSEVDATRTRLAELVALRNTYPDRLTRLRERIEDVAAAERRAAEAYAIAAEKIADPGLPPLPAAAAALRARLSTLDRAGPRPRLSRVAAELATLEQGVSSAADRARQLLDAAEGLLARRAELRGRLDAYRVKAARHGHSEHPVLTVRYTEAHTLLYRAPCDLRAATRAVVRYQQTLSGLIDPAGGRRR